MAKKESPDQPLKFAQGIERLETIVESMEQENVTLEDSLQLFEEGVTLTRQIQGMLSATEQKVARILEVDGAPTEEPFELDAE